MSDDGTGIAKCITEAFDKFEVKGEQLEGGSFDGQYFYLSIKEQLTRVYDLPCTFVCTVDPLHRCGTTDTHIRKYHF